MTGGDFGDSYSEAWDSIETSIEQGAGNAPAYEENGGDEAAEGE